MSRAPRIPNAQWEKHKPTIHELYISQEKKLEDVIKLMVDDHGFQPTKAQYVRKLESWGFKKNSSKEKWEHAAAMVRKRKSEGKETELQMNGKVISTKKLRKEFGRYAYMQSFSWVPPVGLGNDLEGVVARTPPSILSSGFIMPNYLPWFQFQDYLASKFIPRSPSVSNPRWPVSERPPSQSLQSPSSLPEQTWTGILEAKGSHSRFSELLSRNSVTIPRRPGDDTHVQLQHISEAQPFLQVVQRVINLSSNNLLSAKQTDNFLTWVTESGNIRALKEIINRRESTCQTFASKLLLNSIRLRNAELVSAILTRDARPENGNAIPEDAIQIAVCFGNSRIVQLLLDHITAVNTSDSSCQVDRYLNSENTGRYIHFKDAFPLSSAIRYGDITMVRSLLDAGAYVDNMAKDPISALHVAVQEKRLGMVEILLQAGADVNIPLGEDYREFWGISEYYGVPESPLQVAARYGMNEIVQRLLQEGADIDGTWFTSIEMFEEHVEDGIHKLLSLPALEQSGDVIHDLLSPPALEQALSSGQLKTAEVLLNAGANIEGDCLGPTALQAACGSKYLDRLEMARLLLSRGADVNAAAGVWFGRTALQAAAERGDMDLVQLLLDKGANVNAPPCDHGGITALQAAARSGNQDLVQALLEEGGHVNAKPTASFGVTCLQAAVSSGNENMVRMLLEHGAETNTPASDRGEMALPAAVSRGHVGVTEMLLEAGAFVNQIEGELTPLCLAISRRNHELFELLMKYDADPDPPGVRSTPLGIAVAKKELEMASILLIAGADPNRSSYFDDPFGVEPPLVAALRDQWGPSFSIVQVLVKHGANVNDPCSRGNYPIVLALRLRCYDEAKSTLQLLLDAGADVTHLSRNSRWFDMNDSQWKLMRMLLDRGADINAPISSQGTVLQLAVHGGHTDIVQELISRGADINSPVDPLRGGRTALQLAVDMGHTDIAQELILRGADINAPGCSVRGGRTVLQLAVERDNIHIVQELISRRVDIDAPACPKEGRTALQLAVERDNIYIARKLISCGADVNAPPALEAGATALQFAAMKGNIEMAILLLKNQADINAERAPVDGRTALQGAAEHGRLDMVYLLLENDQDPETIEKRCQYAAGFAEQEEHFEIARILREWRRS
ncbi:hypothetical protein CEP52_001098 [Fusarium oligoseptatum]|uniref:Clr5 domain-containing protein n=1 Tax=Fusarium oligoseptatum TaxID=2604345 RepID=A0A428UL74_9HYPO|nr:hypothetical protein CEP52_001098 [Fusarium oligoseptatum]